MNILKNLRSIFGSPANLSPVASLPLGEVQLPGSRPVTLVTAPAQAAAPVATGLVRGNPPDLDQHIRAIGAMSASFPQHRRPARWNKARAPREVRAGTSP